AFRRPTVKKYPQLQSFACVLLVLLFAASLFASPVGSIAGSVKDPSGAVIPGAKLILTNSGTNAKLEGTTDANGAFQFSNLAPGAYSLVIEAPSFKKYSASNVEVQVDQTTRVDVALQVGNISESVEVTGVAPLLESDKSTLSSVVDSRTISNMP